MSKVHLHIPSFNAGELSPLLGARFAVEKVQAGCRRMRNFIPMVHGPAFRRPGMEYIGANAGNGSRSSLRGFNFSTTTGFVLEFHPSGLKVWSNGLQVPLVSPVPLPYSETECGELQMAQVNDVCYLAHSSHRPRKLIRYADDDWRLQEVEWKWPALGDENVRSEEIATPTVTGLLTVPTYEWPEFVIPANTDYTFSIISGNTGSLQKVVKLWKWVENTAHPNKSEWVKVKDQTWRGTLPDPIHGTAPDKKTTFRLTYNEPVATGGSAKVSWRGGSVFSELDLNSPYRQSLNSVSVPAGDWQMTVECPAQLPSGATLAVEKKNADGKWKKYRDLSLKPSQTVISRGEKLTQSTEFRFVWTGRAMMDGEARFERIVFGASTDITVACSGINGNGRTLTASSPIFRPGHIGSIWQIAHRREASGAEIIADVPTITETESDPIRVQGKWDVTTYGTWDATLYLERHVSGTWEVVRSWTSRKDRNVIASGEEENEVEMRLRISDGTSAAAIAAAKPRFLLETVDARVTGLVKITSIGPLDTGGKATTAGVNVVVSLYSTAATALWTEGAWSGEKGYPGTVALHGQRLWFGGTRSEPLRIWGSVISDYENFRRSSLDDASVSYIPAAQQSNRLQWMVSIGETLVLGTNGDEWTVSGGTERGPITPVSVNIQRRSGYGSNYLPAQLLGEVIVFVQRGGRKLREVAPRSDGIDWLASDLTVMAEHVAQAGILQIAAMHFPQAILWAVTADGKLLGLTFEQEQNVFAWHVHETDGLVESVAVVFGFESDEVWLAVNREGRRSIERMDTQAMARRFTERERLVYVDAAKRYESTEPFSTLDGLEHLEGKEVAILGDGAALSSARVVNGAVTLEKAVTKAVAGLRFMSELQPMRFELPLQDGSAQHRSWRVSRVGLFVHESLGGEVADSPESRFERLNYRKTSSPMDSAPALFSGELEVAIESHARAGVDVIIRTNEPLPLNVGSITLKGDIFGE